MKKTFSTILALLLVSLLFGCAPNNNLPDEVQDAGTAVKTGMAVITTIEKSTDATAEKEGAAQVDSTVVALTIDNGGKIVKCKIDSAQTIINFNSNGKITTPLDNVFVSKQELGENYGMKKRHKQRMERAGKRFGRSYVEGKLSMK